MSRGRAPRNLRAWGRAVRRFLAGALVLATIGVAWADGKEGVPDADHWAYRALVRPPVPGGGVEPLNPVDAFLRERLREAGLRPAPEAGRGVLIRRVTFDLTGLPPTPEEVREFERDPSLDAYGQLVDRLLASPRYGERWARHWMDAVHFAETHGHDQDRIRTNAWPYRDWLIESFNADKPYGRFVAEQVAGDVLFPNEPRATLALGMIAAGPWDESSLRDIREDTLDRQIARYVDRDDMVSTVMNVFASTTVQCARCHDHKFDPVPQADYFALQAVFAGVERANRTFDADPVVHRRRQNLLLRRRQVDRGDDGLLLSEAAAAEVSHWIAENRGHPVEWVGVEPRTFVAAGGSVLEVREGGVVFAGGPRPDRDTYLIQSAPGAWEGRTLRGIRLDLLPDAALPKGGPGRQEQNGNLHLSEFVVELFVPGEAKARRLKLVRPTSDFDQDGWTVAHAVDGNEKTAWGIHPEEGRPHAAAFELEPPLTVPRGAVFSFQLRQLHGEGHLIGKFRISVTDSAGPVRILPASIEAIASAAPGSRTEAQRRQLAGFVLRENIRRGLDALPQPSHVYAAAYEFEPDASLRATLAPRRVDILRRGEVTQPVEEARPGTLSCVRGLPSRFEVGGAVEEGARRAALAGWLGARENPLVWRSIVNRVWHWHFGRGLVDTPNDFGRMGSVPSHPALLDWLAVWFRDEAKGSLKALHRLLVTSAAYRQESLVADPRAREVDPDNRLLWRMNRTRLDAEAVRDAVLLLSGTLDLRMGGPGDMQFDLQPGIHVTPKVDYSKFDIDGAASRRRSVYRFLFRTVPDPFMEALDCPAGDQLTPARNNSVTVQQALALWNGVFVTRYAEHLAARVASAEGGGDAGACAARVARWLWCREPSAEELGRMTAHVRGHGLASLCRVLINSNEFVFVD